LGDAGKAACTVRRDYFQHSFHHNGLRIRHRAYVTANCSTRNGNVAAGR
jgi:hypothetical protein